MRTSTIAAALAGALAASGARAQPPAEPVDISMSNFRFEPATIRLHRGASYVIRLHNQARGGHSFEARRFFAAAEMPAADRMRLRNGEVQVPGGEQVAVSVIPGKPGTYRFHCTHPLHSLLGMTGSIVVD